MSNYLVKAVLAGANLIGKSFITAYRRVAGEGAAVKAEKAASGAAVTETSAFVSRRRMRVDEAKKILNIEPKDEANKDPEELAKFINSQYESLYTANAAPAGSFYLQSKIFRAKESLEDEFVRKHGISLVPKKAKTPNADATQTPKTEAKAEQK